MGNIYSDYDFMIIKHKEYNTDVMMHIPSGYYNISKSRHYDIKNQLLTNIDINNWFKSKNAKQIIKNINKNKKIIIKLGLNCFLFFRDC